MDDRTSEPEQLWLLEGMGVDVAKLRERAVALGEMSRAAATRRAYAADWRDFEGWCRRAGRRALPATDDTLSLYLADLLGRRTVATAVRRASGVVDAHRAAGLALPLGRLSRAVLAGARRERGTRVEGKAALSVSDLLAIVAALPGRDPMAARDRALLLLGFALGCRGSELLALDVADVREESRGLVVLVRRSKTDQEGKGREVGIPFGRRVVSCPVRAWRAWLRVRGAAPGAAFVSWSGAGITDRRLSFRGLALVIKSRAEAAGLDASRLGTHSLRAGCVTAAVEAGQSAMAIMQRTGHRSVSTVERYVRPATVFSVDPLKGVL